MITYNSFKCVKYLIIIYVNDFRQNFVKCYINQMLHFETIIIFRNKNNHAVLKRQLKLSKKNLKTMIDDIMLLFINELHNHLIKFEKIKFRYFINFRKRIFHQITAHVIFYVIRRIFFQYDLLIKRSTILNFCINV